ncbi:MAG: polysaccharide pyruvyl transferase family protein [Acutalibacteraceae bacterium]
MRYAFYSHGGCENHGCEAIVRTLSAMIKTGSPDSVIKLYTLNAQSDKAGDLPNIDETEEFNYIRPVSSLSFMQKLKISSLSKKSQKSADEYFYSLSCKNPSLKDNDVYVSVGGDNYCYGDGHMAAAFNRELKKLGKKTVLWGCSVGEEDLSEDKIKDLKTFDLIVTRESMTYETLINCGIDKNTVLYPDPAFTLDIDTAFGSSFEVKPNTLGFNISSLIGEYAGEGESIESIAVGFLRYVLENSDKNILLIPHVTKKEDGDQLILGRIAEKLGSDRVSVVPDTLTAAQYKSIISRCEMFIGARTHATIAAYSTCVPTLVIGYSVKSKGIAKDIFSDYNGLVVPVSEITDAQKLIKAYVSFEEKAELYRNVLNEKMPEYIKAAKASVNELFKI